MEGKGRVCVTGGTGFLGSWIIKTLLEHGYFVNTTVRSDPECKRDLSFLTNLPGASQKLQIFRADLRNPDSFCAAIEGCIGVFHVASPMNFQEEPEEVLTKINIDGAISILRACLNSSTVKRVVYTSSAAAVSLNGKDDDVMDESFWSDVDFLRASKTYGWSYAISKTLTEKAVLEFGELNGLDVVTLLPTYVVGPFLCPKLPMSVGVSLALLFGNKDYYRFLFRMNLVHVEDVARAHIYLLEHPIPKGRYICSTGPTHIEEMHQLLSVKYPEYQIPTLE
ncbi:hypothetical protein L6164_003712 [Bauhinia variegata]|uniref:Uncharacterized protein n=1 Tax=Bauhinia variegata TaxID=167791 RepID=A0ACB9Q4E6_BAUVA|nr:hypothetical protein L6164_003712 [Bauhinia variegata]